MSGPRQAGDIYPTVPSSRLDVPATSALNTMFRQGIVYREAAERPRRKPQRPT